MTISSDSLIFLSVYEQERLKEDAIQLAQQKSKWC